VPCEQVITDVRLTGRCSGRLEVLYKNIFGTVCNRGFGRLEAGVVCAQLGCRSSGTVVKGAPGAGMIWLDGVTCTGSERHLFQCRRLRGWGVHSCTHNQDVSIECA
jgi:hypothetical protein